MPGRPWIPFFNLEDKVGMLSVNTAGIKEVKSERKIDRVIFLQY